VRKLMIEALHETALFGPRTNRDFLLACLETDKFASGDFSTAFIAEEFGDQGHEEPAIDGEALAVLAMRHFLLDQAKVRKRSLGVPDALMNFTSADKVRTPYRLEVRDEIYDLGVTPRVDGHFLVSYGETEFQIRLGAHHEARLEMTVNDKTMVTYAVLAGPVLFASFDARSLSCSNLLALNAAGTDASDGRNVNAPMHGRVIDVYVEAGSEVSIGDRLATVEAMKMQHEVLAQIDGTVDEVRVVKDQQVAADDLMISIVTEEA
jgi:geranyl-CoA carboxylase alpha subunit